MLGKLLKHEYRATFLPPVIICAVLALMSVSQTVVALFADTTRERVPFLMIFAFSFIASIPLAAGAVITVYVLTAIRFYSHIYANQGYLTLMLPVSRTKLHLSKYIVSLTWVALCSTVGFLAVTLPVLALKIEGNSITATIGSLLSDLTPADIARLTVEAVQTFTAYAVSSVSLMSMLFCSVSLGQLFLKKRVLASILIFFAIYFVQYILSIIVSFGYSFVIAFTNIAASQLAYYSPSSPSLIINGVISLAFLIPQYIITDMILKKKVNLQ